MTETLPKNCLETDHAGFTYKGKLFSMKEAMKLKILVLFPPILSLLIL